VGNIVTFFLPAPVAFAGTRCLGPTGAAAFERAAGAMGLGPTGAAAFERAAGARGLGPTGAAAFERAAGAMGLGPTGAAAFERAAGARGLGPTGAAAFERAAGAMDDVATSSIASTSDFGTLFALLRDLDLSSMAFVLGALNDRGLCLTSSTASVCFFADLERALSAIASFVGVSLLADLERGCCFADLVLARGVVEASTSVVVSFGADLALDLLLALAGAAGLSSAFFAFFAFAAGASCASSFSTVTGEGSRFLPLTTAFSPDAIAISLYVSQSSAQTLYVSAGLRLRVPARS
jgi:hypothetical protein